MPEFNLTKRGVNVFMSLLGLYWFWRLGVWYQFCFFRLVVFETDDLMPTPGMTLLELVCCGIEISFAARIAEVEQ